MGNTCTSVSYEVPESQTPLGLPGTPEELQELTSNATVHFPGSAEYGRCRTDKTWMKDPKSFGRPAAILVPTSAEHVAAAVKFASATGVKLCIACGRHTHESVVQGALMIDMSHGMNEVTVDPVTKTVVVQGGANIGKVDQACAPHGLLLPMGRIGTTGCAGQMVTTGAHGYCERTFGLGVDYMIAATVVIGTGEILLCSAEQNPDLFWAIRGGASNFGVVVDMTFKPVVAPNGGKFYAGSYVYLNLGLFGMPSRQKVMDHAVECMDADDRPREYGFSATLIGGGVNPVIETHFWFGEDPEAGKEYITKGPGKKIGTCVANTLGVHDYWNGIQKFAQGPKGDKAGPGAYYYRGVMPSKFTAEMGRHIVDACKGPYPKGIEAVVLVDLMGGKSCDTPVSAMALPARPKNWIVILASYKPEITGPAGREFCVNWVRGLWQKIAACDAQLTGAATVDGESHADIKLQEITEESTMKMGQQASIRKLWGENEARLRDAKHMFDPKNVFGSTIPEF